MSTRVLLVEDHKAVRDAVAAMFENQPGLVVVGQAVTMAEARQMLSGVDVLVINLGLPDGFGGDLIPELRAHNPRAQAVVLTASLDPTDHERARRSGAAAILNKAIELDQVVDTVRRVAPTP